MSELMKYVIGIVLSLHCNHSTFAIPQNIDPIKGKVYIEENKSVFVKSIFKEISGISMQSCLLRCKRSKECLKAAIQQKQSGNLCLHLKNSTTNGNEMVNVTVLEEFENEAKRKFSCFIKCG